MARVQVKLAPWEIVGAFSRGLEPGRDAVRSNLGRYVWLPTIELEGFTAAEAAEEMFDVSNNPSRIISCRKIYGTSRSVSIGDVVCVDDVDYLCVPLGWEKL